jgi:GNAT superfamily N-acetyltransferase
MARRTALKTGTARLRLRTTTARDLPTLVRHRRRMWEEIGGRTRAELDRADPAYRRWVVRETRARRFVGFVVEDGRGRAAGSGAVWLQPAQPRPGKLARLRMPYIMSMYTEPDLRGRGVASRIVRAMVRWATSRGYHRVFLHASSAGRPVYAKLGFTDGSEMRLDLPRRRARR